MGIEKVAIFGITEPGVRIRPTHASRQLLNGKWTSKMGPLEDIEHSPESAVGGPSYGKVIRYLGRKAISTD